MPFSSAQVVTCLFTSRGISATFLTSIPNSIINGERKDLFKIHLYCKIPFRVTQLLHAYSRFHDLSEISKKALWSSWNFQALISTLTANSQEPQVAYILSEGKSKHSISSFSLSGTLEKGAELLLSLCLTQHPTNSFLKALSSKAVWNQIESQSLC